MNEADIELVLMQYAYRSGHAMTSTEILAAKQKAIAEILELHKKALNKSAAEKTGAMKNESE